MAGVLKVLFVCLGNTCRSPMAEAIFTHMVKKRGVQDKWEIDSAGIGGWHVGKPSDPRTIETLKNHSIEFSGTARQIQNEDFNKFDYILAMDENIISKLKELAPENMKAKILLLGDFDPEGERIIRDPYRDTNTEGFEKCYQQCVRCCKEFLNQHN